MTFNESSSPSEGRRLPPDRSDVDTEKPHPSGVSLESLPTEMLVRTLVSDQDRAVRAVEAVSMEIAAVVEGVVAGAPNGRVAQRLKRQQTRMCRAASGK